MISNRVVWYPSNNNKEKKKYHVSIRMIQEGILCDDEDIIISLKGHFQYEFAFKDMCKVIDRSKNYNITKNYFNYW